MHIITTILPIFIVIFLGFLLKHRGMISQSFVAQANRLVYSIAIPAMLFSAISKSSFTTQVDIIVVVVTLSVIFLTGLVAWMAALVLIDNHQTRGSFIQTSFQGNLGYVGFAIAFYYLGDDSFAATAIIGGFLMIFHNLMAVGFLTYYGQGNSSGSRLVDSLQKSIKNPVILSALAGMLFSLLEIPIPLIIHRALDILKGMALPTALLIIGASLSFEQLRPRLPQVIIASLMKTMVAPAIGFSLFTLLALSPTLYLPGLILLSAPTATVTYILSSQMGGDPDFAAAAISFSTLLSSVTYVFWLGVA